MERQWTALFVLAADITDNYRWKKVKMHFWRNFVVVKKYRTENIAIYPESPFFRIKLSCWQFVSVPEELDLYLSEFQSL